MTESGEDHEKCPGHVCDVGDFWGHPRADLVGGLEHVLSCFIFPYIGKFIIPSDELIFFRGAGIPPTSDDRVALSDCLL